MQYKNKWTRVLPHDLFKLLKNLKAKLESSVYIDIKRKRICTCVIHICTVI